MIADLSVAIAGGSIGGLTAGVLLHELGCDVHVYERSTAALQERGAGIVVLAMTERYFTERGGEDERVSLELPWWKYVDSDGIELGADLDHFRFSSWNTVYRALLDAFPSDRYHLDAEMSGFERRPDGVTMQLRDGTDIEADLLLCYDGVASTARRSLLPEIDPVYVGYVAWRATAPEEALASSTVNALADSMLYQVLPNSHVLVYAIANAEGSTEPGSRVQNFVWYRNYPEGGPFESLMTDKEGERRWSSVPPGFVADEHLQEMRVAADQLAPAIRDVVLAAPKPFVQVIFDLEVPRMVFDRVCIMGDAAFVARPHVAAGTAKAAADAWALRDALAGTGSVDEALARWEVTQMELGRSVVERSRRMGQRSQFEGTMFPGDPDWKFGLFGPHN
jgi:2,6-dihydroxypyridine 3-monooxygenase